MERTAFYPQVRGFDLGALPEKVSVPENTKGGHTTTFYGQRPSSMAQARGFDLGALPEKVSVPETTKGGHTTTFYG